MPKKGAPKSTHSLSDLSLVERAIRRVGSVPALATAMGVKPNNPNEWRRRLRLGHELALDKRERLRRLVGSDGAGGSPAASLAPLPLLLKRVAQDTVLPAEAMPELERALTLMTQALANVGPLDPEWQAVMVLLA